MPVSLMQNELGKRVDGFFGGAKRTLQRAAGLSPDVGKATDAAVYAAAKKLSRGLTKSMRMPKRAAAEAASYLVLSILLRMMYLKRSNPMEHSRGLKELILHHMSIDHPLKGPLGFSFTKARDTAVMLSSMLAGAKDLVTLDKSKNLLYRANVRAISDADFWRAYNASTMVKKAFWDGYSEIRRDIPLPDYDAKERARMDALLLSTIVAYQADPWIRGDVFDELLGGSDNQLRKTVRTFVTGIRTFIKLQQLLSRFRGTKNVA